MIRSFVIPAIIVAVFLSIAATLMATSPVLEPSSETPMPMTVRVQTVPTESVELKVHSQGSVVPSTISQLIPEVSGRVVWTSPALVTGGFFNAGQELARIDDLDYRSSRDRANATLKRATAEVEHAKYEYGRLRSLAERKLVSRNAVCQRHRRSAPAQRRQATRFFKPPPTAERQLPARHAAQRNPESRVRRPDHRMDRQDRKSRS